MSATRHSTRGNYGDVNPAIKLGQVVWNTTPDHKEYDRRKELMRSKKPVYPGNGFRDMQLSMQPREFAFWRKSNKANIHRGVPVPVFSSLNGLCEDVTSPDELWQKIGYAGVVVTQSVYDSRNEYPGGDNVVQTVGVREVDNGPEQAHKGDLAMLEFPNFNNPTFRSMRDLGSQEGKILAHIRPFRLEIDGLDRISLQNYLVKHAGPGLVLQVGRTKDPRPQAVREGAAPFASGVLTAALSLLQLLHNEGLITVHPDAFADTGIVDRQDRAKIQSSTGKISKDQWLTIAREIGHPNLEDNQSLPFIETTKKEPLPTAVMSHLLGLQDKTDYMISWGGGKSTFPSGDAGVLHNAQKNALADIIFGVTKIQEARRERIIGQYMTSAGPGEPADLYLSKQCGS